MARPNEYKPSYVKKVDAYLKTKKDRIKKRIKTDGDKSTTWEFVPIVSLPSIDDFANYIKVARQSIYNWRKDHKDFDAALDKIENEQKIRLMNNGLAGTYHPLVAKMLLSANHNMREKIDTTTDDKPITPFSDDQITRIARRILKVKGGSGENTGTEESH